ncbi:MAG: hypothetical protein NUV77_14550, partial [Thermoguttaceae bacterium]|nr:hypothetical protein [Thermoguttaceae bacterium]
LIVIATRDGKSRQRSVTVEPARKRLVSFSWEPLPPGGRAVGTVSEPVAAAAKATSATPVKPSPSVETAVAGGGHPATLPPTSPSAVPEPTTRQSPAIAEPSNEPASVEGHASSSGMGTAAPEASAAVAPTTPGTSPGPKPPDRSPAVVPTIAAYDTLVAEAWELIRAGEVKQGYDKLEDLFKKDRGDFRVAFSLGLVEALVGHDWQEAEKHFATCQRLQPDHPAMLNNLALVRMRTGQEHLAIRQWETLLAAGPPAPEVVQNLRRFQTLAHAGQFRLKPSHLKAIDELARRAAETGAGFKTNVGYLYLPLKGPDGRILGWLEPRKYHDRWCVVCGGRGGVRCPDRDCARGTVRKVQPKTLFLHPISKSRIVEYVPVRVACPVCKGEGWIDCAKCDEGTDASLKDFKDPLSKN